MSTPGPGGGGPSAGAVNPDRAYCAAALDALHRLEAASRRRNDARRDLERRLARRRMVWTCLAAAVLPVVVWVYLFAVQTGLLPAGSDGVAAGVARGFALVGASVLVFLLGLTLANALWGTWVFAGLRRWDEARLRAAYLRERDAIDREAEEILAEPALAEGRIPGKFLATNLIVVLLRLFDSGQATFLEAAVYMLELEIENSAYYANIVPARTLVEREREQIAEDRQEVAARG